LDVRPNTVDVFRNNAYQTVSPESVEIGEKIQVRVGEKAALDGEMISSGSSFNTSALTGESTPKNIKTGETVLAGMVNLDKVIELNVTKKFADSSLARILDMVQNASARKAPTELFIRKFAKIYTPIVFFLAVALTILPYFIVENYIFRDWLYRALVFLVISCPCALVISTPVSIVSAISAAARAGVLFKGGAALEAAGGLRAIAFDKTGTLTAGQPRVTDIVLAGEAHGQAANEREAAILRLAAAVERRSTHPLARAIVAAVEARGLRIPPAEATQNVPGRGVSALVDGVLVQVGNPALFAETPPPSALMAQLHRLEQDGRTVMLVAQGGTLLGLLAAADEARPASRAALAALRAKGITPLWLHMWARRWVWMKCVPICCRMRS
jgi:Cd2+/Zn2+-exporting ATPase